MIRLSPSLLESYRLFLTQDWFTVEKMREAITGDFVPTPAILLGQAYHAMLENQTATHEMYFDTGNPSELEMRVEQDGYTFVYESCVDPVADFLKAGCVHEVKGVKTFESRFGPIQVATKADAVHGNIGGEWKTTEKSIQLAKYMDSVQWKLCCWALNLRAIDYRIIRLEKREDDVWTVKDSDYVQCHYSPSNFDEIVALMDGLVEFHNSQGLAEYLKPYWEREAA